MKMDVVNDSMRNAARRLVHSEYFWVGAAFVVLVLGAYLVLQAVTTSSFDRLERENVSSQAGRIPPAWPTRPR